MDYIVADGFFCYPII